MGSSNDPPTSLLEDSFLWLGSLLCSRCRQIELITSRWEWLAALLMAKRQARRGEETKSAENLGCGRSFLTWVLIVISISQLQFPFLKDFELFCSDLVFPLSHKIKEWQIERLHKDATDKNLKVAQKKSFPCFYIFLLLKKLYVMVEWRPHLFEWINEWMNPHFVRAFFSCHQPIKIYKNWVGLGSLLF